MMAGGPIDVYSRLRRTGAPSAVGKAREGFPTFRVQPSSWRSRAQRLSQHLCNPTSAARLQQVMAIGRNRIFELLLLVLFVYLTLGL